jgi:WD40 repeat protein
MASVNPDKIKQVRDVGRPDILFSVARLPKTSRFFVGSSDFKVHEIDLSQPKVVSKELATHGSYVTSVALAGNVLASGGYDCRLNWWDIAKNQQIRSAAAHAKWIRNLVASPNGKVIASVADDMVCKLWDPATGALIHELRGHLEQTPHHYPSMLYACTFSADGKYIATGDKVGHIVVWETATGTQAATMEAPVMYTWDPSQRRHSIGGIRSLAFSPDGKSLAVGGMGKVGNIDHLEGKARVEVFDWKKRERTHEFQSDRFNGLINHLEFHPQGDWLLGAGGANDGFLMFFNLSSKKVLRQDKAAMHIHKFTMNETADTVYAVGHHRLVVLEMKG